MRYTKQRRYAVGRVLQKLNIHKFKCNGKALEADGLNLRFRKLLETTPAEKAYMDKIKNGTLEKISIEQAKADGLNLTGSTKQVARYKLLDDNYNKTNLEGFDIGGINLLLVYSDVDGQEPGGNRFCGTCSSPDGKCFRH